MFNTKVYRKTFTGFLFTAFLFPVIFESGPASAMGNNPKIDPQRLTALIDSVPRGKKPDDRQTDKHPENKKPDIKEVPKSRRQLKPTEVKIKPIKIIKPKIVKKPHLKLLK